MIIYGHRGAKGEAPENSLPGFRHAYGNGLRHFEMDVMLSGNGEPVVHHDLTTDRTTGQEGRISDRTADELAGMDVRQGTLTWPEHCGIPRLTDVLDACPDFQHLQLEVKSDQRSRMNVLCNRLAELIQRRQWHSRVAITSSDTWVLREIKRRGQYIQTGLVWDRRFPTPLKAARKLDCQYLCLNTKLASASVVEAAHQSRLHVSVWTENRIQQMLELERHGVDSIITDYPTSAHMYFENRRRRVLEPALSD
ncbi:glycerophosphoryl diester phosphodiesterase [Tamilnaduibacter salinus]|uniref:Glycerophosphodiester phosphodiesterase n=1 Tax=Tamilnaduibacter salinus TaxID=1484056 RepID=A0A2A2I7Z9_9GAMM|nr:glycerophosphodiester phosphodiesterase [Tamilnaduibacter salinus]PAV27446.1 glycerophosphodiester phosphodiesterase [Tamilnaduibacter salinus]PVY75442.1 glycerophosphoryl diester phosphodiesterase [Tamilnaduibacter salinus]